MDEMRDRTGGMKMRSAEDGKGRSGRDIEEEERDRGGTRSELAELWWGNGDGGGGSNSIQLMNHHTTRKGTMTTARGVCLSPRVAC